jgi:hypothetical protein
VKFAIEDGRVSFRDVEHDARVPLRQRLKDRRYDVG